jgi:DNA recombination protein RmuC
VKSLSDKQYWAQFEATPEFVVMFVGSDVFLDAALQENPALQETAFKGNVVIATPSTLMALLRTIAYVWRQEALAEDARRIADLGRDLYERLATVGGHVGALGKSLGRTVDVYNQAVGSLETRVFPAARKMRDLKVSDKPLEEIEPLEVAPRPLGAPELLASADLRALREEDELREHLAQLAFPTEDDAPGRRAG